MRTSIMLVRSLRLVSILLVLSRLSAAQTATISEVGIQGFYSAAGNATRVRVQLSNPTAQPTTLNVTLSVADKGVRFGRVDKFSASAPLRSAEMRVLDLPIPLWAPHPVLTLDAVTADGKSVAHETRLLEPRDSNSLVLLLCAEEKVCNQVLGAIQSSGNDTQKTRKTKKYTFLVVKDPPEEWWAYSPVHSVILARPASGLRVRQREALEGYCRDQGQLALLENLVGPGFLDVDRSRPPTDGGDNVGTGWLFRFAGPDELAAFFDRSVQEYPGGDIAQRFREVIRYRSYLFDNPGRELVTVFEFPTLRWLIVWLLVYIVVVGAMNFVLLTRINRRELAWVTVPGIAVVFALMFYLMSASKRPAKPELDEVGTYYLNDDGLVATAYYDLRVSSPRRQDMTLIVPGDSVWNGADRQVSPIATFSVFDRRAVASDGWEVRLLPRRKFSIPLLQWSYQDMSFTGLTKLPGRVKALGAGQLTNETGLSFREAIYRADGRVYDLGTVAAGATFGPKGAGEDVEAVRKAWQEAGREPPGVPFDRNSQDDVKRMLIENSHSRNPMFAGLAEAPVLNADLEGKDFTHRQYIVVVVTLERKP